jgi:rfaE bifunctional protein kinase chain/domain
MFDSQNEIVSLFHGMRGASVTVFGDFCLDAYWGLCEETPELSVETGLPVRRVKTQRYSLGGAGSVLANLIDMGVGCVRAIGVVGTDIFGDKLRALLAAGGADVSGFVADAGWETMVYAKPCFGAREDSRIDFGAFNTLLPELLDKLMKELEAAAVQSDAVILNQQIPAGLSSPTVIDRINEMVAAHPGIAFLVDARHYPEKYKGAALKLTMSEAARLLNENAEIALTETRARDFAERISQKSGKPAFLTRGELGIVVAADGETTLIPGLQVIEQVDPVGAGDAVVAALAAALAAGASPVRASELANIAGMITVKKLQTTGTASAAEILAAAPALNYVFRPELANSPRHARHIPETDIEVIGDIPTDLSIKHCIFDHDGTLSTLREGWEQIMETMMLRAILGRHHDTVDEEAFERVREAVRQLIDRTTGVQTLVQMVGLADLVRHFGFVAAGEVLDEHGYKHIFNVELLKRVKGRVNKLQKGELEPKDFQIKNAGLLLSELYRRGVKLYLASGTDEADAIAEAEAMGYAHFFEERIFGAVGDINVEAKKMVLEKIIRENGLSGHEFATFGDGPVEIRETQRRGGLCVGVASDELRRFGLNLSKRKRLIRAGANLIVPDFSQLPKLLKVLQLDKSGSLGRQELIEEMQ